MALNKTYITIGTLVLLLLATGVIYITMSDDLRIRVDDDKSTFYVKSDSNRWIVSGREYNSIFDGSSKMNRDLKTIKITQNIEQNSVTIKRSTGFKRGPVIIDTYTFDGAISDLEKFPIDHTVEIINGSGYFYRYEVRDLDYDGPSLTLDTTSFYFGLNMKVEFDAGYRWAKVYKSGILKVQYDIPSDHEIYHVRLFDPPTNLYLESLERNITAELGSIINITSIGSDVICIDVDHPQGGINVSCTDSLVQYDLNITYFQKTDVTQLSYCYQETANVSTTCGGLSSGTYGSIVSAANNGTFYINYTKPNAKNATWMLRHGNVPDKYNVTIPDSCFNYDSNKIILKIFSLHNGTQGTSQPYCYDGVWKPIGNLRSLVCAVGSIVTNEDITDMLDGDYDSYLIPRSAPDRWGTGGCSATRIYEESIFWYWDYKVSIPAHRYDTLLNFTLFLTANSTKKTQLLPSDVGSVFTTSVSATYINSTLAYDGDYDTYSYLRSDGGDYIGQVQLYQNYSRPINSLNTTLRYKYLVYSDCNSPSTVTLQIDSYCYNVTNQWQKYANNTFKGLKTARTYDETVDVPNSCLTSNDLKTWNALYAWNGCAGGSLTALYFYDESVNWTTVFPKNVTIYINNTLSNDIGPVLNVTDFELFTFNDISDTKSLTFTKDSSSILGYFNLPKSSTVNSSNHRITSSNYTFISNIIEADKYVCSGSVQNCYGGADNSKTTRVAETVATGNTIFYSNYTNTSPVNSFNLTYKYNIDNNPKQTMNGSCWNGTLWNTLFTLNSTNYTESIGYSTLPLTCLINSTIQFKTQMLTTATSGSADPSLYYLQVNWNYTDNPSNVFMEIGSIDGSREFEQLGYFTTSNITSDTSSAFNTYLSSCTADSNGYCTIPVILYSKTPGTIAISNNNINYTNTLNPIQINLTLTQNYINSFNGNLNVPIIITHDEGGALYVSNITFNYLGGNDTIAVKAHTANYSTNISYYVTYYYSGWNYSLPQYVDYIEFIPKSQSDTNVSAYGQRSKTPLFNITTLNYGGKNLNMTITLNATDSCVNLSVSNSSTKSDGSVIVSSIKFLDNIALDSNKGAWLWADYGCSDTSWRLWYPELSIAACCQGCDVCDGGT